MAEFPNLYPYSRSDARSMNEEQRWQDSFRNNVQCARDIEQAINQFYDEEADRLKPGCAEAVLEKWGFKRTRFVLANTLQQELPQYRHQYAQENQDWGQQVYVPSDGKYSRYFTVDRGIGLTDSFIGQTREMYQALGLFGPEHCEGNLHEQDFTGKVLAISPDVLREDCWQPRNMLWYAEGGFGCSPTSVGRAVYATCLGDGEEARWNRTDFVGVLKEEFLPDWAREKLEEIQAPKQEGPSMGGMS